MSQCQWRATFASQRVAKNPPQSVKVVAKMVAENPAMKSATVPNVGHAPTLDEPEAQAAIDALLKRVLAKKG